MNTALRNSILCLVAIGLVAGVTGTIYGVTKKTRNLVSDDASVSSTTSGSTSQAGSSSGATSSTPASSTPGSSSSSSSSSSTTPTPVAPKIEFSKNTVVLDASTYNTLPSTTLTATITGTWAKSKNLVWTSTGNSFFTLSKSATSSGEEVVVQATAAFDKPLSISVFSGEDHTLRATIPVTFYNRIYAARIYNMEVSNASGLLHTISQCDNSSTDNKGAGAFTKEGTNGTYFNCPGLQMTDDESYLASDPESALTGKHVIDITCSNDFKLLVCFRFYEAISSITPSYYANWASKTSDVTSYLDTYYSISTNFSLSLPYQDHYTEYSPSFWIYKYSLTLGSGFNGGTIMLKIDNLYAAIRFHPYVAPSSITGVGDTTI